MQYLLFAQNFKSEKLSHYLMSKVILSYILHVSNKIEIKLFVGGLLFQILMILFFLQSFHGEHLKMIKHIQKDIKLKKCNFTQTIQHIYRLGSGR